MRSKPRLVDRILPASCLLALNMAFAGPPPSVGEGKSDSPIEMSFMKGDSRKGSQVRLRIVGDSLYYREVRYRPGQSPVEDAKAFRLSGHRRQALKGVMGHLPSYPVFGSCFGRDMRFYLVETAEGKFYRSVPERAGGCYADEPGIWSLFQDLDDLLAPPAEPEFRDYSAS